MSDPKKAAMKTASSPTFGMYIIFKYDAKFTFPETQEKTPNAKTIIAEVHAARPYIPSVKLAPLETAVMIKITIGIKIIQVNLPLGIPIQPISQW